MAMIEHPYKFIIDTSAMLSQKGNEPYRRTVLRSQWASLDEMVKREEIVTCSELKIEVQDKSILDWMEECGMRILPIDREVQEYVKQVVKTNKLLVDFKLNKSSGDAFLIATAMKYGLTVITNERKNAPTRIPYTCQMLDVPCLNVMDFFEEQHFIY